MNNELYTRKPRSVAIAVTLVALVTLTVSGCGKDPSAMPVTPVLEVATHPVSAANGYDAVRVYTGTVEAAKTSALGLEIGGKIAEVLVDDGDRVRAGEVLAGLDTARLDAKRKELAAAVSQVGAELKLARATLERTEDALSYKGISRQQYDEAFERVNALSSANAVAQARLDAVLVDIEKSVLRAPFDAVVVHRLADEGEVLAAGAPILEVQSTAAPEIRVGLASRVANEIAAGDEHVFEIGGRKTRARVKSVIARLDDRTRTVDVIFVVQQESPTVRPGDLARLELTNRHSEPGFWVPVSSLAKGVRGLWTNYVVELDAGGVESGATHRIASRTVEIIYSDAERAYVRGTLRDGDELVVDGLHRIVPGQLVTVTTHDAKKTERLAAANPED